jgi:hypothetical protein
MPWTDAFIPAEIEYRNQIATDTWGHLAPKKGKTYPGRIVYAVGCFGDDPLNPLPIFCEFDGLDSSPWFYNALIDFISGQENEEGCIYEFKGTFRNYTFKGQIVKLMDVNAG